MPDIPPLPPKTTKRTVVKTAESTGLPDFDSQEYVDTAPEPGPVPVPRMFTSSGQSQLPPGRKPQPPRRQLPNTNKVDNLFDDPQYVDTDKDSETKGNVLKKETSDSSVGPTRSVKPPIQPRPILPPRPETKSKPVKPPRRKPKIDNKQTTGNGREQEEQHAKTYNKDDKLLRSGSPVGQIDGDDVTSLPPPPPRPLPRAEHNSVIVDKVSESDISQRPPAPIPGMDHRTADNSSPIPIIKQEDVNTPLDSVQRPPMPIPRPMMDNLGDIIQRPTSLFLSSPDLSERPPLPIPRPESSFLGVSPNVSPHSSINLSKEGSEAPPLSPSSPATTNIQRMPSRLPPPPPKRKTSELSGASQTPVDKTPEVIDEDSPLDDSHDNSTASDPEGDDYIDMTQGSITYNQGKGTDSLRDRPPAPLPLTDRDSVRRSQQGFEDIPFVDLVPPMPQPRPTSRPIGIAASDSFDVNTDTFDHKIPSRPSNQTFSKFVLPPGDSDIQDKPLPPPPTFVTERSENKQPSDEDELDIYTGADDLNNKNFEIEHIEGKEANTVITDGELAYELIVNKPRSRVQPVSQSTQNQKRVTSNLIDLSACDSTDSSGVIEPAVQLPPMHEPCAYQTTNLIDNDVVPRSKRESYRSKPPDTPPPPPPIETLPSEIQITSPRNDDQASSPLFRSFGKNIKDMDSEDLPQPQPQPPVPPPRSDSHSPPSEYSELEAPKPQQTAKTDSPPPLPPFPDNASMSIRQPISVPIPTVPRKSAVPPDLPIRMLGPKQIRPSVLSTISIVPLKDETDEETTRTGYDSEDSDTSEEYSPDSELRGLEVSQRIRERRMKTASQLSAHTPVQKSQRKEGYLYKQGGKQANKGWRKRWVVFNGKDLRYFGNKGDHVSKRIIPVGSMRDVENSVKGPTAYLEDALSHPYALFSPLSGDRSYRFFLLTSNRKYQFAADNLDDMQVWASTIMEAIIHYKAPEGGFPDGGDMFKPDKQGYVKMEGAKRYFAIKGSVLCYYSSLDDYITAAPISEIQMNIASVREKHIVKNKFSLTTPYQNCCLIFENNDETKQWADVMEEAIKEGLSDKKALLFVQQEESNRYCADCGAEGPDWASINLFVVICKLCAGYHRGLGVEISKVRSLRMDILSLTPNIQQLLLKIGNQKANSVWAGLLNPSDRIKPAAAEEHRRVFIENKYRNKRFLKTHPIKQRDGQTALDEALIAAATSDDCLTAVTHMVYSGADVTATSELGLTAFEVAKENNQPLIMEFLIQNGGVGGFGSPSRGDDSPRLEPRPVHHPVVPSPVVANIPECTKLSNYLYKTGASRKDFQKRWCVFDNGTLTYYLDEKTTVAKNSVEACDILSVSSKDLEFATKLGYPYCFEVGTRSGRTYVFSADKQPDKRRWVSTIAKSISPKDVWDKLEYFDRAGYLYFKEGAAKPWQKSWFVLHGKKLMYYSVEKNGMDIREMDLRKLMSISQQLDQNRPSSSETNQIINIVMPPGYTGMYIGAESKQENEGWYNAIKTQAAGSGKNLHEQQLTGDNIPVLVEQCIEFVARHGMKEVGIYRTAGQESKVEGLLRDFSQDARAVRLDSGKYPLNEVTNALKRFFRNLPEPLLTKALYPQWIEKSGYEHDAKLKWFQHLIGELSIVNRETLKKLIGHLNRVAEYKDENKMTVANLAAVWGPTLMGNISNAGDGFGQTNKEIAIIGEIITFYEWLFNITKEEKLKEEQLSAAEAKFQQVAQHKRTATSMMLIGADIEGQKQINIGVEGRTTADEFLKNVITNHHLDTSKEYAVFEVLHKGELERPLHGSEKVLGVVTSWASEKDHKAADNTLSVKTNNLKSMLEQAAGLSPYGTLRVCTERKNFKKMYMELQGKMLRCCKDNKGTTRPEGEWSVDQLNIYIGSDKKSPPTSYAFTFRSEDGKTSRSVCCENAYEHSQWISALYSAKYPDGFSSGGTPNQSQGASFEDAYQMLQDPCRPQPFTSQLNVEGTPKLKSPLRDSMGTRFDHFTSELAHKARKFSVRRKKY
ncbi:arf-GAP with Rho-GAP domain, ANK repeat and PH domain-containing protein 2-like [Glandiceps talaboti]